MGQAGYSVTMWRLRNWKGILVAEIKGSQPHTGLQSPGLEWLKEKTP